MIVFKVNLLLFAALFIISITSANGMSRLNSLIILENRSLSEASHGIENYVMLFCDNTSYNNKNCTVILQSNFSKEPKVSLACEVKLTPKEAGRKIWYKTWVNIFGENKAILSWKEYTDGLRYGQLEPVLRFSIINLSDCKITEASLMLKYEAAYDGRQPPVLATYEDNFDAFFPCEEDYKYNCKVSFDKNGKQTSDVVVFSNNSISRAIPVALDGSTKKFMYHEILDYKIRDSSKKRIELKFDGKTLIKNTESDASDDGISTAYEILGWCFNVNATTANCMQFNLQGELLLQTIVDFKVGTGPGYTMYNLGEGGFLIAQLYYQPTNRGSREFDGTFKVKKIDSRGREVAALSTAPLPRCIAIKLRQFLEVSGNQYCMIIECYQPDSYNRDVGLNLITECFNDYEMEKKL